MRTLTRRLRDAYDRGHYDGEHGVANHRTMMAPSHDPGHGRDRSEVRSDAVEAMYATGYAVGRRRLDNRVKETAERLKTPPEAVRLVFRNEEPVWCGVCGLQITEGSYHGHDPAPDHPHARDCRCAKCEADRRSPTGTQPPNDSGLNDAELRAMGVTVELVNVVCQEVIGRGPTREQDVREFVDKVHQLQALVMAQAAARAHPDRFRLLGDTR